MNKAIKWLLIIIAGTGVLFGVILLILPFIIDPNDYKEQINTIVYEQTGRVLSIPGDIKLQISPKLAYSPPILPSELSNSSSTEAWPTGLR